MIRKENVNIVEMNRKMISASTLKPSLDAFPIKDISVPFNSTRNMEINNPESLLGNDIGIANKIAEIKNNKVDLNAEKNENIQLNIVDLENDYNNNVILSPAETTKKVLELVNNIKNELIHEDNHNNNPNNNSNNNPNNNHNNNNNNNNANNNNANNNNANNANNNNAEESNYLPPTYEQHKKDSNLVRSIMDIKRNSNISKQLVILFFIIMAVLIYKGYHKKLR
jgi:hypothetical protein